VTELDLGTLRGHVDLDVAGFDRKYGDVQKLLKQLTRTPIPDLKIALDADGVLSDTGRIEAALRALPDEEVRVIADTAGAIGDLAKVEAGARGLPDAELRVEADTSAAQGALDGLAADAGEAGADAGDEAGSNLAGGILAALATIPVAGAIVGIGAAIGDAMLDGLQNEVRSDRLMAQAGLDPVQVALVGRGAGEAYANNFGESIAGNMETARVAIAAGLLDRDATVRDTQAVIQNLQGVADVLQGDVVGAAQAVARMLDTGVARSADEAFDILVRGYQTTGDLSQDLLDTFKEYSSGFAAMGLTGAQAMGLMNQAVQGGVMNTDYAADSIREWGRIAREEPDKAAAYWKSLNLDVDAMNAAVAKGGPAAAEAFGQTLAAIQKVEDPQKRSLLYVQALGDAAGDFGLAWDNLDLTSAVDQLGAVEGAAKTALQTLGDNSAGIVESAERNIGVAADGIKGALAAAFAPQIEGAATFVTENREAVMTFLLGAANAALDMGRAGVEGFAVMTEAGGRFVAGPLADMVDGLASFLNGLDNIPGIDTGDAEASMRSLASEMRGADEAAASAADTLRTNLIENGLDPAQQRLNDFAIPLVTQAALHDAMTSVASDLDGVGYALDGATRLVDAFTIAQDGTVTAGADLDRQIRDVVAGLDAQTLAGHAAGEGQTDLTARYEEGRLALLNQLQQMGLTTEQAQALADKYGAIPGRVDTVIAADKTDAQAKADAITTKFDEIRNANPTAKIFADTTSADRSIDALLAKARSIGIGAIPSSIAAPGFADGGYTGDGGTEEPAGIVHGKEFVVDATATRRYRAVLEAMNAGTFDPGDYTLASPGLYEPLGPAVGRASALLGTVRA
jgi:hypothetical protein